NEFRYRGRPLPALQALDRTGRVVYGGTFSKVLFPSLRLGYLVVPEQLVDAFVAARSAVDRYPPSAEQAVLAGFMSQGHLAAHGGRMTTVYAERQFALIEAVRAELGGCVEIEPQPAGIHAVAYLKSPLSDVDVSEAAASLGVDARPLAPYYLGRAGPPA